MKPRPSSHPRTSSAATVATTLSLSTSVPTNGSSSSTFTHAVVTRKSPTGKRSTLASWRTAAFWCIVTVICAMTTLGPYYYIRHFSPMDSNGTSWSVLEEKQRPFPKRQPKRQSKADPVAATANTKQVEEHAQEKQPESKDRPDYFIVFSTSCDNQQHWESYVFFYHCRRIRQPGTITRIASGCRDDEAQQLQDFHHRYIAPMALQELQRFELHFTPDYSRVRLENGKHPYKYHNKPFGLLHWMQHNLQLQWDNDTLGSETQKDQVNIAQMARRLKNATAITSPNHSRQQHNRLLDAIVILMDPDMVLLKPISHDFSVPPQQPQQQQEQYQYNHLWVDPIHTKVTHGHPIAQQDGYLGNEWMSLNFSYICNDDSIRPPKRHADGPRYWNTGPPYLATVADMFRIATIWTHTSPRVLDVYPELFAEMFGFIIATVLSQLPFALTKSIVVSTTDATDREGWALIDAIPDNDICTVATSAVSTTKSSSSSSTAAATPDATAHILPTGLHYCSIYILNKTMFSKYRIKKNIMRCDKNLMLPPTPDLFPSLDNKASSSYFAITPPRADLQDATTYREVRRPMNALKAKREAFMLCGMIASLNQALRYYKQQACMDGNNETGPLNLNETYTIHTDPTNF